MEGFRLLLTCLRITGANFQSPGQFRICARKLTMRTRNAAGSLTARRAFSVCRKLEFSNTHPSNAKIDNMRAVCRLDNRGLLRVAGQDSADLLQGLMTNDVDILREESQQRLTYAFFLNTQGRVLFDTLVYKDTEPNESTSFLIECDRDILPKLQKHIKFYKLRKKVDLTDVSDRYHVWSMFSSKPLQSGLHKPWLSDPRLNAFMCRAISKDSEMGEDIRLCNEEEYRIHRYQLGLPEGADDFPLGQILPLEANAVFMNGVDFTKGCYLGQELTARTHHTGVIRKRFMPVRLKSMSRTIPFGTSVLNEKGRKAGKFISQEGDLGIALLKVAMSMNGETLYVKHDDGEKSEMVASVPCWWPEELEH